jgi:hypothetical protein
VASDGFPDLADQGLELFECGQGDAIGEDFQPPEDAEYQADCWAGSTGEPYYAVANSIVDDLVIATEGTDVSAQACPEDVLNASGGVACRAVLVEGDGDDVLVRIVTVLSDLEGVLSALPEEPTDADVDAVLVDAPIEVLIGTEPLPEG